jgi:hypothetical protein
MFYDLAVQAWLRSETKIGAREGPEADGAAAYLLERLSSVGSGGSTTRRPPIGKALSSMLKPGLSLVRKAAPILVRRLPVLPLLSYSSTVKTLR